MADGVGTTHNIRLAGQHYLIRPGTYRKSPAPLFGARFTTGDPDYNNLSMWQHWVQSCWVGGFGAETWRDDAMFDEGAGIDASQHEVMLLTRDLGPNANRAVDNWDLTGEAGPTSNYKNRQFVVFNGKLYCLEPDDSGSFGYFWRYNDGTATWTQIYAFGVYTPSVMEFGSYLVFGTEGANLVRMDTAEAFTTIAKPGGVSDAVWAMQTYRERLYVDFRGKWYRLKPDFTWDGSTVFYETTGVFRYAVAMTVHLGMLYVGTYNGHIYRTDGNNTFDIWQFEDGQAIDSMRSFDGRLFVATSEALAGTDTQQAVLYQFTGSAVTELKRWGRVGSYVNVGNMRVFSGRLFFGAPSLLGMDDGFGIAMYDPREDAYHLFSTNHDGTTYPGGTVHQRWLVSDVMFYRGYMYAAVAGHGVFRTQWSYRDASRFLATYDTTPAGGSVASLNGGWYVSSDFDAGTPGLLKLWNAITVHVDLPTNACSAYVDYSTDGGVTYTALGSVTKDTAATRYSKMLMFPSGGLRSTRLKYRITLRTTDTTRSPALRSVTVRYLPLPEPGWRWEFQVIISDRQELLDHTREVPNIQTLDAAGVEAKIDAIENAFRSQALVNFVDVDGQEWTVGGGAGVLVLDMTKDFPVPGPNSDGAQEALIRVVLIEAVEAY